MAMHAQPLPIDPYNPSSPASASSGAQTLHPSPYVPIRLRVFAPVIFLNDCIVSVLSLCMRSRKGTRPAMFSPDRGGAASRRMEDGDGDGDGEELRPLPRVPTLRQTAAGRRKFDYSSILDVSRLHISIHNNIYHAIAYYPTYHRAEGVQSKAKSFSCPNLPEPRPLDADVRDLSALGVPATQEMRLLRCRTEPSVRHNFHRAQWGGRRGLHGGNEVRMIA